MVATPEQADFAILRLETPWVPVETPNPFARGFHHGDLDFKGEQLAEILDLLNKAPTIVVIYLDRPAVIPEIKRGGRRRCWGTTAPATRAMLEVIFGKAPSGGQAALRAALVDGGGAQAEGRRAVRFGESAISVWVWVILLRFQIFQQLCYSLLHTAF